MNFEKQLDVLFQYNILEKLRVSLLCKPRLVISQGPVPEPALISSELTDLLFMYTFGIKYSHF